MKAYIFPGQGAQFPGMGKDLFENSKTAYDLFNIANEILELTNSNSEITFKDLPIDDPVRRKPDISRAAEVLSWTPLVKRKTGFLETIKYFSKVLN